MAFVGATFSADLSHLLHLLFASPQNAPPGAPPPPAPPTVHDAVALVCGRMMTPHPDLTLTLTATLTVTLPLPLPLPPRSPAA